MAIILAILTYVAYIFIIVVDARKAITYARMPMHLRWDLYPGVHENGRGHGSSHDEDPKGGKKTRQNRFIKGIFFLLKDNFYLGEYFHQNRGYWFVLFPWHVGFILIITFNAFCLLCALATVLGLFVSPESPNLFGRIFYYSILVTGVGSFFTGSLGSIGMIVKRLSSRELRAYASPINYFNYVFLLGVFASGFYAWCFVDPTFSEYREFWRGLVTFGPRDVHLAWAIHIVLFALVKLYLPFTRSMHYLTRFFAFFWIQWDDRPNLRGSEIEKKTQECLNQPVSWSAPHIQSGKKWRELALESTISSAGEVRS
jgi:nitrate reductase gamma subunit